jgi:hypothetical protein
VVEDEDEAVEFVVHCCLVDNEQASDDHPYDDGHYVRLSPVVHFNLFGLAYLYRSVYMFNHGFCRHYCTHAARRNHGFCRHHYTQVARALSPLEARNLCSVASLKQLPSSSDAMTK